MGASPGGATAGSPDDVVLPMPPQAPRTRSGPALRWVARTLLRLGGWRMAGTLPDLPKLVLIGAPHSSNWDGVWGMLVKVALGLDIRIFAKRELFWWPLGPILRRMGVIPVDRNAARGLIEQMLERFQQEDRFWLGIAPEGTRKRVERWKPGFWKMVHQPVVLISCSGRNDEMNRPNVGIVQITAMTSATTVAVRDVRRRLTRAVFGSRITSSSSSPSPLPPATGRSAGATLLIGSPSASGGR